MEDILQEVDIFKADIPEDDGLLPTTRSLNYEPSTSATSDGFMSNSFTPTSQSNTPDLHLELPTFRSLLDDLTEWLQPTQMEARSPPPFNSIGSIRDRRDDLIEELLDHVSQLREKVRSLGDDNSRLRRQITDNPSHHDALTNSRSKHTADKALNRSSTASPTRPYTSRKNSSQEDEHNSQEDCDSAYSYYNNPDYFPNTSSHTPSLPSPTTRLRARTESVLQVDSFIPSGYPQRRRYYSLPTPRQCKEYMELRRRDNTKLELGSHLRRLINLRCSVPSERPTLDKPIIRDTSTVNKESTSPEISPSSWSLRNSGKGPFRRPQPRIQLSALEPIFRCFSCSQRFGHCAYADCIWIGDHYVNFGYFEMIYYHAAFGLWGPANMVTEYYNSMVEQSQPLDENALEAENRPFAEDNEDEVEANAVISEVAPLSSIHLLEGTRRENVESFVTANEHAVSDAQRRRERHIALLDSIIEEEELEDVPSPTHLSSPATTGIHHPKPTRVSEMAQQTILAVIPEQEVDSSNESTTTSQSCPPLTDDSSSSARSLEQGSSVTFDDFEDIDLLSTSNSECTSGYSPVAASMQVNTVTFPIAQPLTEKLAVWDLPDALACN